MGEMIPFSIFLVVFSSGMVYSVPMASSVANKLNKVVFVYPNDVVSERDLSYCHERSACNIIYQRFWFSPIVERLCRCPERIECPWTWSSSPDNHTMSLDNRSQIKFCMDVSELPKCTVKKPAMLTVTQTKNGNDSDVTTRNGKNGNFKLLKENGRKNVTALCNCQEPHYWKLKVNGTKIDERNKQTHSSYYCSKLQKCKSGDFCGHIRLDTYSTYYRCSCPIGHLCIKENNTIYQADEMLYNSTAYKASCHLVKN